VKNVNAQNSKVYLVSLGVMLILFTALLIGHYVSPPIYASLVFALLLSSLAVLFSGRLKELYLGKFALKLYRQGEEGLSFNKTAMSIAQILVKLDEHVPGPASHRKEREAMINKLLISLKADRATRAKMLENAKLITKLMATEDESELDKIRAEIDAKGLFD
jgi:hypothetical protein